MRFTAAWGRAAVVTAGLAATITAFAGSASATTQDLHVAVWDLGNNLVSDATVAFETATGGTKGVLQPDGFYLVSNDTAKGTILVEHDVLGAVSLEVMLPEQPLVDVDVIFLGVGDADFVLPQPRLKAAERGREGFNGEPASNDDCEDASTISTPGPGSNIIISGTTFDATIDNQFPFCGTSITAPGVWYRVLGSGFPMQASTCSFATYDTKISVYCGSCAEPTCITGNDDACPEFRSMVDWCSQEGVEYLILVHGFSSQSGDFQLEVSSADQDCIPDVVCAVAPTGACCLPSGECEDGLTADECAAANGYYQGDGITCEGGFIEYIVEPSSNTFVDITASGNALVLGDDDFTEVPIGFSFPFFGDPITDIKVCSNGYLTTGADGTDFTNDPCLDPTDPNSAMFVLWDDWSPNVSGEVHYLTTGSPGSRIFTAQWTDVPRFADSSLTATFQARLHECCGAIDYCYASLVGVPEVPNITTIGVEDETGLDGACISDQDIAEGVCWQIVPIVQEPVDCPCRFLDFQTEDDFTTPLVAGQDISSPPEFGNLFLINGYGSGTPGLAVFDSDPAGPCVGGPDPDLLVDLGNILILQSIDSDEQTVPGIYDVPDDASTGGVIEVEFLWAVEPRRIDLIDICEPDFYTQVFLWDDYGRTRTYAVPGGWTTDIYEEGGAGYGTLRLDTLSPQPGVNGTEATATQSPGFDHYNVEYMEIHLGNSGAIDNFEFCLSESDTPTGG